MARYSPRVPLQVGYLTRGQPVDSVEVVRPLSDMRPLAESNLGYSELKITRWVHNYKEMSFSGGEVSKPIEKKWPPIEFETEGVRLALESSWSDGPWDRAAAIKGLEHVLLVFAPAVVVCDPLDIDATSDASCIYLYDSFGGGMGITRAVFDRFDEVVHLARETVEACPCERGLPGLHRLEPPP